MCPECQRKALLKRQRVSYTFSPETIQLIKDGMKTEEAMNESAYVEALIIEALAERESN